MTTFTITVSRPCAALRSNGGHGNKFAINRARRDAKTEAFRAARVAHHIVENGINGYVNLGDATQDATNGAKVNISYTEILGPKQRAMDDDNLIAAMKPYRDGIALALGINDKRMVTHPCGTARRGEVSGVRVRVWWSKEK